AAALAERAAGADEAVEAARQLAGRLDDDHDEALVERLVAVVVGIAGLDLERLRGRGGRGVGARGGQRGGRGDDGGGGGGEDGEEGLAGHVPSTGPGGPRHAHLGGGSSHLP